MIVCYIILHGIIICALIIISSSSMILMIIKAWAAGPPRAARLEEVQAWILYKEFTRLAETRLAENTLN